MLTFIHKWLRVRQYFHTHTHTNTPVCLTLTAFRVAELPFRHLSSASEASADPSVVVVQGCEGCLPAENGHLPLGDTFIKCDRGTS